MKPIRSTLLAVLLGSMALSCMKEGPASESGKDFDDAAENVNVTFSLAGSAGETKAGESDNNEAIRSLDIYIYDENGLRLGHYAASQDELTANKVTLQYKANTDHYYIFLANLDPATALYLEGMNGTELNTEKAYIFLSNNNYSEQYMPLCGSAHVLYSSDRSVSVEMYRYMYRIDVGNLTIDFDDEEMMNRNVYLKSVTLANSANVFRVAGYWEGGYNLSRTIGKIDFFFSKGVKFNFPAFGNDTGYLYSGHVTETTPAKTYNISGGAYPEALRGSYACCFNNNYRKEKGVLNVDATGDMLKATHVAFSRSTSMLCSSTNPALEHSKGIDHIFYGMPIEFYSSKEGDILCTYANQDGTAKLIVTLEIDGQDYFYPIPVRHPQPNTKYIVDNITIKSKGSDYSNFFEKNIAATFSVTVSPWTEKEVDNINVGYKDDETDTY